MSFREAFTKSKEQLLDYDDNAACYFMGALLLVAATPVFLCVLYQLRLFITCSRVDQTTNSKGERYVLCECTLCKAERQRRRRCERSRILCSKELWLSLALCICLGALLYWLIYSLANVKEITTFDPYEILGVPTSAAEKVIRRAFRTLSLKHHPDRNANDPASQAKFVMLTKAYQALTDETARKNYQRYGNPDGPGAMKVGIGLPSFIVAEENQGAVLMFCVAWLVVVVPLCFFIYYVYGTSRYHPNGVRVDTVHLLGACMKDSTAGTDALELLANIAESWEQPYKEGDLERLKKSLSVELPLADRKMEYSDSPVVKRNFFLLVAHLSRKHHLIPQDMRIYLEKLLTVSPHVIQTMIEIAVVHNWSECAKYLVDFLRCLVHASFFGAPYIIQLPHSTQQLGQKLIEARLVSLRDFTKGDNVEKRDQILREVVTNETYRADIQAFIRHVPNTTLLLRIETEGEKLIATGDVVTVTVTLERPYLKPGEAAGPVHAPLFPIPKHEEWCFFLLSKVTRTLIASTSIGGDGREAQEKMRFAAPNPGGYIFELIVMNNSYIGLDMILNVPITVVSKAEAARDVFVHPDDLQLDGQPSILSQVLGVPAGGEEEEDEDEDIGNSGAGMSTDKTK